jgi:hypothetical protein
MPSLDKNFLYKLREDYKEYKCFIETGTYTGNTIFNMEQLFDKLYTIEISEHLYKNTSSLYRGNKINFILGDSVKVFNYLLPLLNEKCIFFLDGHYSGGVTGKSEKDCPLNEEIQSINTNFNNEAIIIIDDYRLFGTKGNEDWLNINKDDILFILKDRIKEVYHLDSELSLNDRLIIHICKK